MIKLVGDGYSLQLGSAILDLAVFEDLVRQGRAARRGADTARAAGLLRDAPEEDPVPAPPDRRLPGRHRPGNRTLLTTCSTSSTWLSGIGPGPREWPGRLAIPRPGPKTSRCHRAW